MWQGRRGKRKGRRGRNERRVSRGGRSSWKGVAIDPLFYNDMNQII